MSITQLLLDFLLNLLKDPKAAAEFSEDPQGVLEAHGLGDICQEDVDAVVPVVLDFAPISAIGDRVYETGGNVTKGGDAYTNTGNSGGGSGGGNGGGGHHGGGDVLPPPVAQLHHVVNNYTYTTTDDRDTIVDQSVNQNIWALGDVNQWFDNDANVASGDYAVAAGDDAWVDNSEDNSTNVSLDAEGDINIGNTDVDVEDSFNDNSDHSVDNSTDNSIDVDITDSFNPTDSFNDNSTDVDVDVDDSFNTDNSINDSGNTVNATDSFNETDVDVDVDAEFNDSFNTDNSTTTTTTTTNNTATNSFNDNSTNTDVDVDAKIEDSFNEVDYTDNSTNVETGDIDVDAEFTSYEDSIVLDESPVAVAVDDSAAGAAVVD
jgi:hypothetical protein